MDSDVLQSVKHLFVPEPSQQIPITWKTYPMALIHFIPLLYMSYLARKPNTYHTRLLMLPFLIALTIHTGFAYRYVQPQYEPLNAPLRLMAMYCIALTLDYATIKGPLRKLTEVEAEKKATTLNGSHSTGTSSVKDAEDKIGPWYLQGMDLMLSVRGIGWEFGQDIYIPRDPRPQDRIPFLQHTAIYIVKSILLFDFLTSFLQLVPGLLKVGGTMWLPSLSPLPRYALSTLINISTGQLLLTTIELVNYILSFIAVGIFNQSPSLWRPLIDNPWASESLHELWSKRWHQMLRRMFLLLGAYPGRFIAGKLGYVMGAFIFSAYYHEYGLSSLGEGWDNTVVYFFILQGFLVTLEALYKQITGKKVGGWAGRVWVYLDMMILAQPLANSYFRRGALKSLPLPLILSPTKRFLWPLISGIVGF